MTRLAAYLVRIFSADALALFGVASLLLFLVQCLRSFEVVTVKGQDFLTLVGQSLLSMPTLAIAFTHVCIGIGLARGLRSLQLSQELHIIHASRRTRALFGAIATYTLACTAIIFVLVHVLEPATKRYFNTWAASVAADLVSRTLTPNRFIEVTPGVTLVIGSRGFNGEIGTFFADDRRSAGVRRTYIAQSASVSSDDQGYVIQLRDGSVQYMSPEFRYSEISFSRYDLAVERLTGQTDEIGGLETIGSWDLVQRALATGGAERDVLTSIGTRMGEVLRVIAICLLVTAMAAFPHSRRAAYEFPIEILVLLAAFAERAFTANFPTELPLLPHGGPIAMAVLAILVLGWRLRHKFVPRPAGVTP